MNYNREFLVPYLQNICALHFADIELNEKLKGLKISEEKLKKGEHKEFFNKGNFYGPKEYIDTSWMIPCGILGGIILCASIFPFVRSMKNGFIETKPVLFVLAGMIMFALGFGSWIDGKRHNKKVDYEYAKENERVEKAKEANERARREQLPAIQRDFVKYSIERENVRDLLKEAYDVNIIPSRYRDIYTAVYLYDYFSTSMSTDLEAALNLYVLEQIKDRLDKIIENQAEIILNQRVMIAKQQESIVLQKEHNENLISKINKMIAGDEERNMYLNMIEFNTSATAYFAAADYFRSRKDTIV